MPCARASARQEFLLRSVAVGFARRHLVGRARAENAEVLGQQHEPRALGGGRGDQRLGLRQILGDVAAGHHLHGGDAEARHGGTAVVCGGHRPSSYRVAGATGAGALAVDASPPRETMGSDQLPVTRYS